MKNAVGFILLATLLLPASGCKDRDRRPPPPPASLPDVSATPATRAETTEVAVRVELGPRYFVDGVPQNNLAQLEETLKQLDPNETTIVLQPNRNTPWEDVLATYNALLVAGFRKISWDGD